MTFWYWLLSWLPFEWAAPDTMLFMKNALLAVLVVTPLFGLLSTMAMLGRSGKLDIYAPRSFAPVLKFFLSYYGEGLNYPIEHHALEMKAPQLLFEDKLIRVSAFPLRHKIDCYGFLFREQQPQLNVKKMEIAARGLSLEEIATAKRGEDIIRGDRVIPNSELTYLPYEPRSYAYCSDTAPFPELSTWVKGVDLLYHEATYTRDMEDKAAERFHSTAAQAALCAKEAGAGQLLLGHYSSKYRDLSVLLEEAKEIFPATCLGKDLDVIDIPLKKLL